MSTSIEEQRDALAVALQSAEAKLSLLYWRGGLKHPEGTLGLPSKDEISQTISAARRALNMMPQGDLGRLIREDDRRQRDATHRGTEEAGT